jgi:hypothetical protein
MSLGSGIRDPGSGINLFRIPDPGFKKAPIPDPGSGSATLIVIIINFFKTLQCTDCYGDAVMEEGEGGERHCHNKSLLFKVWAFLSFSLRGESNWASQPDPVILLSVEACKKYR